jgi:sec-independent protein translocase protein TatA
MLAMSPPGPFELLLILAVILLLFGGKKLPDLARALGRSMSEFKKGREEGLRADGKKDEKEADAAGGPDKPA